MGSILSGLSFFFVNWGDDAGNKLGGLLDRIVSVVKFFSSFLVSKRIISDID